MLLHVTDSRRAGHRTCHPRRAPAACRWPGHPLLAWGCPRQCWRLFETQVDHVLMVSRLVIDVSGDGPAFSKPPMRCISPGVPGMAHGRASRSSRAYGWKTSSSVRRARVLNLDRRERPWRPEASRALNRWLYSPSDKKKPGVMYRTAIRHASWTAIKAIGGAASGNDRHRAIHRCVRTPPATSLLVPFWSAGRARTAALDVHDYQRQFRHHGQDRSPLA